MHLLAPYYAKMTLLQKLEIEHVTVFKSETLIHYCASLVWRHAFRSISVYVSEQHSTFFFIVDISIYNYSAKGFISSACEWEKIAGARQIRGIFFQKNFVHLCVFHKCWRYLHILPQNSDAVLERKRMFETRKTETTFTFMKVDLK